MLINAYLLQIHVYDGILKYDAYFDMHMHPIN